MEYRAENTASIKSLLTIALAQAGIVNSVILDIDNHANLELSMEEENTISSIMNELSWPEAVDTNLIASTEDAKIGRAESILALFFNTSMANHRFLDFGCGEGHAVAVAARDGARMAVGYDATQNERWAAFDPAPNMVLTTSFADVSANGPYDYILMCDVLDHCADPILTLSQAKGLLADGGRISVRCHPWCSRHGGHTYKGFNKAFAHLMLTDRAVIKLSEGVLPIQKVMWPKHTYAAWFAGAGLNVVSEDFVIDKVESFMKVGSPAVAIKALYKNTEYMKYMGNNAFPEYPMSMSFCDYVLSK